MQKINLQPHCISTMKSFGSQFEQSRATIKIIVAKLTILSILTYIICVVDGNAQALSQNIIEDRLENNEEEVDLFNKNGFVDKIEKIFIYKNDLYTIAQLRGKFCKTTNRCLTLISARCRKKKCPMAFLLAGPTFAQMDNFVDYIGPRTGIVFDNTVGVLISEDNLIFIPVGDVEAKGGKNG